MLLLTNLGFCKNAHFTGFIPPVKDAIFPINDHHRKNKKMAIKGLLFDKDGTLLDFNKSWVPVNRIAAMTMAQNDGDLADVLLNKTGQTGNSVAANSILAMGNTHEIVSAWLDILPGQHNLNKAVVLIDGIFQTEGAKSAVPLPDMTTTIQNLHSSGYKMGLATSDSHQGALKSLSTFDVIDYFHFISGYDSGHGHKPGPGMVHGFCQALQLRPQEIAVIGDNAHDLDMGQNAGVGLCIGVLSGTGNRDTLSTADHIIESISELPTLLSKFEISSTTTPV